MENRECPNCNEKGVSAKSLFLHSILFKRIYCSSCGQRIKSKMKFIPLILVDVLNQAILIGSIIGALAMKNWIVFVAGLLLAIAIASASIMHGRLVAVPGHFSKGPLS